MSIELDVHPDLYKYKPIVFFSTVMNREEHIVPSTNA